MFEIASALKLPSGTFIEQIARDLVRVRPMGDGGLITTPVIYPSGSHVTVRVSFDKGRCLVTDDGCGFVEAEYMGGTAIYRTMARRIAQACDLRFNSFGVFEAEARSDTVAGFISIVADASRKAVEQTSELIADRNTSDARTLVFDRLMEAFGVDNVDQDVTFTGASSHAWNLDALVRLQDTAVAVAVTSAVPASVTSAYVILDDIRRLVEAPRTAIALIRIDTFKSDQLALLSRTARLIDFKAPKADFLDLAA